MAQSQRTQVPPLPAAADVEAAAKRIAGFAVRTPILESDAVNARLGGRLLIKAEPLQRSGSFKFRGAFNRLRQLDDEQRRHGVAAFSSGNHAQGVAAAAALLGIPAVIVMPADAPASKLAGTRARGAEVVVYDRWREDREEIAARLAAERNAVLVKPFDDEGVIAGQGTVGLELIAQAKGAGAELDAILVPCSGGGLTAGIALAVAEHSPRTAVVPVEPRGFDDTARSLAAGHWVANAAGGRSICDALLAAEPGRLTFAINRRLAAPGLAVDDSAAEAAVVAAFQHYKLVVEPSGAVALAGVLSGAYGIRGKTAAVVCSGGNVDAPVYAAILARAAPFSH